MHFKSRTGSMTGTGAVCSKFGNLFQDTKLSPNDGPAKYIIVSLKISLQYTITDIDFQVTPNIV